MVTGDVRCSDSFEDKAVRVAIGLQRAKRKQGLQLLPLLIADEEWLLLLPQLNPGDTHSPRRTLATTACN